MSSSEILAGKAFVKLSLKDELSQGMKSAQVKLRAFGDSLTKIGGVMLGASAAIGSAFLVAINKAGSAAEVMSKFNVVFGNSATAMKNWSDSLAANIGRAKNEVYGFTAGLQDLFVPLGFSANAAEDMTKQVTQLAYDLASFNNKADADVVNDLQAALTGSGEVMKKYGVIVNETAVKQELLNMSLDPKTATETEKVMARLNIILRGTTAAQGDAERTAGSFANQMKRLKGEFDNTLVALGNAVLPAVTAFVSGINQIVPRIATWVEQNQGLVKALGGITAAVGVIGGSLLALGISASAVSVAIGGIGTVLGAIAAVSAPVLVAIAAIGGSLVALGGVVYAFWDDIKGPFLKYFDAVKKTAFSFFERLKSVSNTVLNAFAETWKKIRPESAGFFADLFGFLEKAVPYIGAFAEKLLEIGGTILVTQIENFERIWSIVSRIGKVISTVWLAGFKELVGVLHMAVIAAEKLGLISRSSVRSEVKAAKSEKEPEAKTVSAFYALIEEIKKNTQASAIQNKLLEQVKEKTGVDVIRSSLQASIDKEAENLRQLETEYKAEQRSIKAMIQAEHTKYLLTPVPTSPQEAADQQQAYSKILGNLFQELENNEAAYEENKVAIESHTEQLKRAQSRLKLEEEKFKEGITRREELRAVEDETASFGSVDTGLDDLEKGFSDKMKAFQDEIDEVNIRFDSALAEGGPVTAKALEEKRKAEIAAIYKSQRDAVIKAMAELGSIEDTIADMDVPDIPDAKATTGIRRTIEDKEARFNWLRKQETLTEGVSEEAKKLEDEIIALTHRLALAEAGAEKLEAFEMLKGKAEELKRSLADADRSIRRDMVPDAKEEKKGSVEAKGSSRGTFSFLEAARGLVGIEDLDRQRNFLLKEMRDELVKRRRLDEGRVVL